MLQGWITHTWQWHNIWHVSELEIPKRLLGKTHCKSIGITYNWWMWDSEGWCVAVGCTNGWLNSWGSMLSSSTTCRHLSSRFWLRSSPESSERRLSSDFSSVLTSFGNRPPNDTVLLEPTSPNCSPLLTSFSSGNARIPKEFLCLLSLSLFRSFEVWLMSWVWWDPYVDVSNEVNGDDLLSAVVIHILRRRMWSWPSATKTAMPLGCARWREFQPLLCQHVDVVATMVWFGGNQGWIHELLYNFDQFVRHISQAHLTNRNSVSVTGHLGYLKGLCVIHTQFCS